MILGMYWDMRAPSLTIPPQACVNKVIAHNSFSVPILTTTVEILNWTIDKIKEIDIKTCKKLIMSRNFHPNEDIDKLYFPRGQGGHDIKLITWMFESRIISIAQYIKMNKNENNILNFVYQQEQQEIIQLSQQLLNLYHIEYDKGHPWMTSLLGREWGLSKF